MPLIMHRIARPHPVTGRTSLYAVNGSSFSIVGIPDDEALDLLDELAAHSTQPKYRYSLKYGVGDVVIWDNASLLHSATLIDPDDARTLWRITVLEPPFVTARWCVAAACSSSVRRMRSRGLTWRFAVRWAEPPSTRPTRTRTRSIADIPRAIRPGSDEWRLGRTARAVSTSCPDFAFGATRSAHSACTTPAWPWMMCLVILDGN
jgi:hypothetical protein